MDINITMKNAQVTEGGVPQRGSGVKAWPLLTSLVMNEERSQFLLSTVGKIFLFKNGTLVGVKDNQHAFDKFSEQIKREENNEKKNTVK